MLVSIKSLRAELRLAMPCLGVEFAYEVRSDGSNPMACNFSE